jgi:alpha-amylase
VKIWNSGYPKEPEKGYCTISPTRNAVQNDDHDQQTSGSTSRDMGDQGCVLVEGCTADKHRSFEMKLFDSPNGAYDNDNHYPIRMVLSSFYWQNNSFGVPDGLSDCSKCTSQCSSCHSTVYWPAYNADSCGYDSTYTRPHRDINIVNSMRKWMHLPSISYADLGLTKCSAN